MPGPKPQGTTAVRLKRIAKVSELYVHGRTMKEIGDKLKIGTTTVYRDICAAREMWRTRSAEAIAEAKNKELARIDALELEAWKAWKRSIGKHKKTVEKSGTRPGPQGGKFDESREEVERLAGDPRFLDQINKCIEHRRRILGLDAPAKLANPDGSKLFDRLEIVYVNDPRKEDSKD